MNKEVFPYSADHVSYIGQEAWFEVNRYHPIEAEIAGIKDFDPRPYILVINSYGRLRKLYTDTGKYEDISDGGHI